VASRLVRSLILVFDRLMVLVLNQRIAADGDDGEFSGHV
jgi:hypothetical protein